MNVPSTVLREALQAYVQTFRVPDRLKSYLAEKHLEDMSDSITQELDSTLKTAEDYLCDYPGGVPWTEEFKGKYEKTLLSKHPWMDRPSLDRIIAFSGWLCWHEGLNAR